MFVYDKYMTMTDVQYQSQELLGYVGLNLFPRLPIPSMTASALTIYPRCLHLNFQKVGYLGFQIQNLGF